jgi:hypothetical protein
MTLVELRERMLPEELWLWSTFYQLRQQEEKASIDKARRRR